MDKGKRQLAIAKGKSTAVCHLEGSLLDKWQKKRRGVECWIMNYVWNADDTDLYDKCRKCWVMIDCHEDKLGDLTRKQLKVGKNIVTFV